MAIAWVSAFFRNVDAFQIERLDAWFADNIILRIANNPAINDKQTALRTLRGCFKTITGLQHKPEALVGSRNEVAQQAIVTYTRTDGRLVLLQVLSYLRRHAAVKLDRLWIYFDINPLYAEKLAR